MPIKFKMENKVLFGWTLIHQTLDSIIRCEEMTFSNFGITAKQHAVLSAIQNLDDPVTLKDLVDCFDRDSPSITFIINRMEKDGLVSRVRDLKDRRSLRVILTPKGKKIYQSTIKLKNKLSEEIMKVLSDEELSAFIDSIEKIQEKTYEYRGVKMLVKEIKR